MRLLELLDAVEPARNRTCCAKHRPEAKESRSAAHYGSGVEEPMLSSCHNNMILQEVYIWCQLPDVAFDVVDGHLGHEHLH